LELKILYIGIDNRYWRHLQEAFSETYAKELTFEFRKVDDNLLPDYRKLLRLVMHATPDLILVDFATQSESLIKLVTLLRRINATKGIALTGLFSNSEFPKTVLSALSAGILLTQLKGADDFQDVIYNSISLVEKDKAKEPSFYKLAFRKGHDAIMAETCRVNYISKDRIHVETSLGYSSVEELEMSNQIPLDVVPSIQFSVKEIEEGPLYYNSNLALSLQFEYADRLILPERKLTKMDEAKRADDQEKRSNEIIKSQKNLDEWIKNGLKASSPKKVKILIIEQSLSIIEQGEKWIWDYPYSFRLQTHIADPELELKRYRPNFIAIDIFHPIEIEEPKQEESKKGNKEEKKQEPIIDQDFVKSVIGTIKRIPDYSPFIFIFNLESIPSEKAREIFNYDKLVVNNKQIQFENLIKLAEVFDQKGKFFIAAEIKEVLYISKYEPLSFAYIKHHIKIKSISECEMIFECERQIPLFTHFSLEVPANFYITIIPHKKTGQYTGAKDTYRALIHSQNLEEKNKLRKFIIAKSKE